MSLLHWLSTVRPRTTIQGRRLFEVFFETVIGQSGYDSRNTSSCVPGHLLQLTLLVLHTRAPPQLTLLVLHTRAPPQLTLLVLYTRAPPQLTLLYSQFENLSSYPCSPKITSRPGEDSDDESDADRHSHHEEPPLSPVTPITLATPGNGEAASDDSQADSNGMKCSTSDIRNKSDVNNV